MPKSCQLLTRYSAPPLPSLGRGLVLEQLLTCSVVEVTIGLSFGADKLGSPSSGGCTEMEGTVLSSSMGMGLALMGGGGGAKQ